MRYIYICLMSMTLTSVVAQVGINTKLPLRPLHIDGGGDNPAVGLPSAIQEKNDVVVDTEGKVGIGTISPNAKLDVRGDVNVAGGMKVNSIEPLPNNELSSVFANKSGVIGTTLISEKTSLAYLESYEKLNTEAAFVNTYNRGEEITLGFKPDNLKINMGGIIGVSDGNIKVNEEGYYQLSFFLTMYMSVAATYPNGPNGNPAYYDQLVYFKSQILKSSDGGKTWAIALVSIRPIYYAEYGIRFYTMSYPSIIAKLNKDDLIKVVYTRSKKGSSVEGFNMHTVHPEGGEGLGFKTFQFSISKL